MPSEKNHRLRLFYALWPESETRNELMQLQQKFAGRKTAYANLHVTLAFLGQQPAESLPVLKEILLRLPKTVLDLTIDQLGYFSRHRIAWAGMHAVPDALLALRQSLVENLAGRSIGFDSEGKFKPHVTLARDAPPPLDIVFEPIRWQANQLVLVQSITRPEGPEYRILASRLLQQEGWIASMSGVD
jgi:2'-5' RNA ligase